MKVSLETLGCKLNQAETELLSRQLAEAGHRLVTPPDEVDVYILNTCTITGMADARTRQRLRLAHRRNPKALLVAVGCAAQRMPRELAQIEGVKLVVGNDRKWQLLQLLEEAGCAPGLIAGGEDVGGNFPALRTRAFIKVQDGCDGSCAYCIVPLVRGEEHSLPVSQVVAEVRRRVANEAKEIVLTGTDIGLYNDGGTDLKGLLERILAGSAAIRMRLSSLQPRDISAEFILLWRDDRLCPHFHLSLQSGSDGVLRRMKRRYSTAEYQRAVTLIREQLPESAITTDIIVGFPGETEEEFSRSYDFCRRMEFAHIHVFAYSPREGTEAAEMLDQVSAEIKKERSRRMLALAGESTESFNRRFLGSIRPVLWEQPAGDVWSGLSDNYIRVYTRSDADLTNQLLPVKLTELRGDGLWGG